MKWMDTWTVPAAGLKGLAEVGAPFWDAQQLCGRPLFGVWGLPWSGPTATLTALGGVAILAVLALAGALLLRAAGKREAGSWMALAFVCLPFVLGSFGQKAGLAVAPFALVALIEAPLVLAAAVFALLLSTLSAGALLAVVVLAALLKRNRNALFAALAAGAALSAPAWLPVLVRNTVVVEAGRAWPVMAPSEFFASVAWALGAWMLLRGLRRGLWIAAVLSLGLSVLFFRPWAETVPVESKVNFNTVLTRYLSSAAVPVDAPAALNFVGAQDGIGSLTSIRRWHRAAELGAGDPALLSTASVGWVAGVSPQAGVRWNRAVPAAMVDEGGSLSMEPARWTGRSLFERPLKIPSAPAAKPGGAWQVLGPEAKIGGMTVLTMPNLHQDAWVFWSQSFDPGWQVLVRDNAANKRGIVAEAEDGFMAVRISENTTAVAFAYQPPYSRVGLALFFMAFLLLVWQERRFLL